MMEGPNGFTVVSTLAKVCLPLRQFPNGLDFDGTTRKDP